MNDVLKTYFCGMQKLLLAALFFAQLTQAQTVSIKIELLENNKTPIAGATLKLMERLDTSKLQFAISGVDGSAKFQAQVDQQYLLEATYTGMAPLKKGLLVRKSTSVYQFFMAEDATALAAVTIKATKPLMRQEDDMTIVDPGPIAETSTSAYEILEKTPGLFLDQDGNVYLSSTTPATIYINGREQKMSREDIASMLKNLPPNSIERLEIMRTPSAKYDASGGGGIVNVVLKKGVKIGRTGSLSGGMNQGRFGNQFVGLSLNNSDGGRSSYVNLNYSNRNSYDQLLTTRQLSTDTSLVQDAYTTSPGQSLFAGFGLGFELKPMWTLDVDGRGSLNFNNSATNTQNQILDLNNAFVINDNLNDLHNDGHSFFYDQGISTKYKLDTLGSELTADASYAYNQSFNRQDFDLVSIIPVSQTTLGGLGDIESARHSFSAQVDFKYKFPYKITLETGAKTALQSFDNQTAYKTIVNGAENPDPFRTNAFRYKEAIHAGYLQGSKTFGQFILKAGVRLEGTNMFGQQRVPSDTSFSIQRADLFPYVFLSRRLFSIASYELRGYLVYRKSISRPAYSYLNPFPRFLDQYLYESGNPGLRPQFTENYEANISFEERPIFAIGRNYTQDIFTNVVYQDPNLPGVAYRTYDNLGKNEETYFKIVGALPPGGKYFFVAGAQYNYNKYNGLYQNEPYTFERGSWSFFTYHQLKLGKRSQATLNGFYRLKGQLQFYELSDFGSVNLSINREFLKRKLVVTLSMRDVFFTNNNNFKLDQGSITAFGERFSDTRRFGVNVRYSFGLKKREENGGGFDLNSFDKSGG
jgi:iron complex outermembrane recepter protein